MATLIQHPLCNVGSRLHYSVLHVDLACLLSREGRVHLQDTLLLVALKLFSVEPLLLVPGSKEQHALANLEPLPGLHHSLLRDSTPRGQSCAHARHDDRLLRLLGQHNGARSHGAHDLCSRLLLLHVACALAQAEFLGALHRPVHQHHAQLDLVRMHQRRAGNRIAAGLQDWHHLKQVLDGRSCTRKLLQHIRMVCEVVCQVPVQGRALLAVLDDTLELLLLCLILCEESQRLEEFPVWLSEDVQDVGEELAHAQLRRTPVACALERQDPQVLPGIEPHHLTEFQDLVFRVAGPDGKALACLVSNVGAFNLELIMPNVTIILGITCQHVVGEQRESVGTGRDDVIIADGWLCHVAC
mmetsp:Transcript_38729/g.79336  ORF Transcript_38729/g.79336 Transcript_38729/m.79336 type:complete len:356 (-) Transcript_38729:551-1618(-)